MELAEVLDREVENLLPELIEIRHHLHQHPETAWEEVETGRFLGERLEAQSVRHRSGVAQNGIVVDIDGKQDGPLVAYRADMDALSITEETNASYASVVPSKMHACGHDLHMTVALGVSVVATRVRNRLRGALRVLFQPAEEPVPAGSSAMIEAGVMDDVAAIYAIHCEPSLPRGHVGLRYGPVTASMDIFDLEILGKGGHSSRPHLSVDAILIAAKITEAIYQLRARKIDPLDNAVITVGSVVGGSAANVICDRVRLTGTIRCFDGEIRDEIARSLGETARGIARSMGGEVEVEIRRGAPPLINSAKLVDVVKTAAAQVVEPETVHIIERASMGGEDFSRYTLHAPGALIRIGTGAPGFDAPLHTARFDSGDEPIAPALRLMLRALFSYARA